MLEVQSAPRLSSHPPPPRRPTGDTSPTPKGAPCAPRRSTTYSPRRTHPPGTTPPPPPPPAPTLATHDAPSQASTQPPRPHPPPTRRPEASAQRTGLDPRVTRQRDARPRIRHRTLHR